MISFFKKQLGLWISCTLTNKKSNYILNKYMIKNILKKKTKIKKNINLRQKLFSQKKQKKRKLSTKPRKKTYLMVNCWRTHLFKLQAPPCKKKGGKYQPTRQ